MSEPVTIDKNNKLSPAEDYNFLRKEGIRLIQDLAGRVWTDYNTHDPGITLLEAICFALTDLGYRTSFDIKDIIAAPEPALFTWKNIFYTARQILPSTPVTLTDYRKVIIDVEGVRNAWIEISDDYEIPMYLQAEERPDEGAPTTYKLNYEPQRGDELLRLRGLYKVFVEFENDIIQGNKEEAIVKNIKDRLFANRNISEDFISVSSVEYEYFSIEAEIQVSEGADIEKINARIYEVLYDFFSPPIKFYSLEQMLERGCPSEEIFEGPLLNHGFIDTGELEKSERSKDIHLSDIINLLFRVEGIIAVKKFSIPGEGRRVFGDFTQWIINVKDRQKAPRLDMENSVITFVRSGDRHRDEGEKRPNKNRVMAVFSFLQAAKFSSKLNAALGDFPVPAGEFMNIADYYPFQKNLPAVYGMSEAYLDKRLDALSIRQVTNELLDEKVGLQIRYILEGLLLETTDKETALKVMDELLDPQLDDYAVDLVLEGVTSNRLHEAALKQVIKNLRLNPHDRFTVSEVLNALLEEHRKHPVVLSGKAKLIQRLAAEVTDLPLSQVQTEEDLNKINEAYKTIQLEQLSNNKKLVLQLRGFLMIFEQILSDYLSQLAHINDLFSFDPVVRQTYFPQSLQDVPDLEALFIDYQKYAVALQEMVETDEKFHNRRNGMLDHLIGRFSEDMTKYSYFLKSALGRQGDNKMIADKANFLADYIQISSGRGKGFDYSNAEGIWDTDNVGGMKKRICRLLGIGNYARKFIAADNIYIEKVEVDDQIERYVVVLTDPLNKENVLIRSVEYEFESEAREIQNYILHTGADESLYEKEGRRDKWIYQLKRPTQENDFEIVARQQFKDKDTADAAFEKTIQILGGFSRDENFHIIEHILLRPKVSPREKTFKKNYSALDADTVDLLSVAYVSEEKDEVVNRQEKEKYRFKIGKITDLKQRNRNIWRLTLVKDDNSETLVVNEDFVFYKHLTRRIEQIRQFGADRANYFIKEDANGGYIFSIKDGPRDLALGAQPYQSKDELEEEILSLVNHFSFENTLLTDKDENYDDISYFADPYSFQLSIVIPDWPAKFRNSTFKHLLEKTIYMETPAHIYPHIYWLDHAQMRQFEEAYRLWVDELSQAEIPNTEVANNLISKLNELRR